MAERYPWMTDEDAKAICSIARLRAAGVALDDVESRIVVYGDARAMGMTPVEAMCKVSEFVATSPQVMKDLSECDTDGDVIATVHRHFSKIGVHPDNAETFIDAYRAARECGGTINEALGFMGEMMKDAARLMANGGKP